MRERSTVRRPRDADRRGVSAALALAAWSVLALAACAPGDRPKRRFHAAIDCAGPVVPPELGARCKPFRSSLKD